MVALRSTEVFEYLHTFSLEVEFIWKSNWDLAKILFLLARYTVIFDVPVTTYCRRISPLHSPPNSLITAQMP
ncbi:hypothetical protein H0H81_005114 [Sphagnurus paluster]|uniref:DUF6533 domain-containing protein n=1 Tax=Sphagnurus paluster TaxID=117069 RepID=A0A9P7FU35_9AGAR|nr:hypothetical protein H0H81_005114 [Sphagnurus paluster]